MALNPEIENAQRFLDNANRLAITNTALSAVARLNLSAAPGRYHLLFTKAARFKQGPVTVTVTSSTGTPALENQWFFDVEVSGVDDGYFDVLTTVTSESGFVEAVKVR